MALPAAKKRDSSPRNSGSLTSLVPLDPRHGVFPNLVMTPLMATAFHLHPNASLVAQFMSQVTEILEDTSPRRLNVLQQPTGDENQLHPSVIDILSKINPHQDLLLVFGYWSVSAIIMYLLQEKTCFRDSDVHHFNNRFLGEALKLAKPANLLPDRLPECLTPKTGIYFRLCSDPDPEGTGMTRILRQTSRKMAFSEDRIEQAIPLLRALIPLPHNEAYDRYPYGNAQNSFMLCRDLREQKNIDSPTNVFWRYMGKRIRDRLLN